MFYVAVDIGCIECGEESSVLGIFTSREEAISVLNDHEERHRQNWHGQHSFEIFEISEINKIHKIEYK